MYTVINVMRKYVLIELCTVHYGYNFIAFSKEKEKILYDIF